MTQHKKKNRWYDQHPKLGDLIEGLKELSRADRNRIFREMKQTMLAYDSEIINKTVMHYPLDLINRRWYDKEPLSWMTINGLKFADDVLREQIVELLEKKLKLA